MVERKVDEKMIVQLLMERGIHLDHTEDIITWWQKENELCVQIDGVIRIKIGGNK